MLDSAVKPRHLAERVLLSSLVALAGGHAGCRVDPTQVVVVVHSDLTVPDELDGIRVHVVGESREFTDTFALAADQPRPSFGVAPRDGDPSSRVRIEVAALRESGEVLATWAETSFIEHRQLMLDLWLMRHCRERCEDGQSCGREVCQDGVVDSRTLPDWSGEPAPDEFDAGVADAGPPPSDRASVVGWADEGGALELGAAVAGPDGRVYWTGFLLGTGWITGSPVGTAEAFTGFVACVEPDHSACWSPRLIVVEDGVIIPWALVLDPQGRLVLASSLLGSAVFDPDAPIPGPVELPPSELVLARFSTDTGALDTAVPIDSDGHVELYALVSGRAGVALIASCLGPVAGSPCAGLFLAPLDESLAPRCLATIAADELSDPGGAAYDDLFAVGALLISGQVNPSGDYGGTGSDNLSWVVAYDNDCEAGWPNIRTWTGLQEGIVLAGGGDELLVLAESSGYEVHDGSDPVEAPLGTYAFVDRLDVQGSRVYADFVDFPFTMPVVAGGPLSDGVVPIGLRARPSQLVGVGDPRWTREVPALAAVHMLASDAATDVVSVMGRLLGATSFGDALPEIGGEPNRVDAAYLWQFSP